MQKKRFLDFFKGFTTFEYCLVIIGLVLTLAVSIIFKGNIFAILTSLIGVMGVFFNAKGNIIGAVLLTLQSIFYAIISFSSALYGEVIIYLVLVMPMKLFGVFEWIKNRSKEDKLVVNINKLSYKEHLVVFALSAVLFVGSYFLLKTFNTASLVLSTVSVVTCIMEIYYNLRREKFSCVVALINNIVVILMWLFVVLQTGDLSVLSIIVCSLINSISNTYGFFVWRKLYKKQNNIAPQVNPTSEKQEDIKTEQ